MSGCVGAKYELCGAADSGEEASSLALGMIVVLIGGNPYDLLPDIGVLAPAGRGGSMGAGRPLTKSDDEYECCAACGGCGYGGCVVVG